MAVQNDPNLQGREFRDARRESIRKVITDNFYFEAMARDTLGTDQWNGLTPGQRSEFTSIFQDLFLDSYSRMVLDFLKKEKIEYNARESGRDKEIVKTVIHRVDDRIPVDYLVTSLNGRRWVCDVTIDGVSIVQNYRSSFSRIIRKESYNGLLKRMLLQQKAAAGKTQ